MASVYKAVSKKNSRQLEEDQDMEDVEMEDIIAGADDTSDSDSEEDEVEAKKQVPSGQMPKTRVLMLTSRGVTHRYVLFWG